MTLWHAWAVGIVPMLYPPAKWCGALHLGLQLAYNTFSFSGVRFSAHSTLATGTMPLPAKAWCCITKAMSGACL